MTQVHWKKAVDGAFADSARWRGRAVPGVGDDAVLDAAGAAFTVSSFADATVAGVDTAANATLAIEGGTFTLRALDNAGAVHVTGGGILAAQGTFHNLGAITLDGAGAGAHLVVGDLGVELTGGGTLVLGGMGAEITGEAAPDNLTNVDTTIRGAGVLGGGQMTLLNRDKGVIEADKAGGILLIDVGVSTVVNAGRIEAVGHGRAIIVSAVSNGGLIEALGGRLTLEGAVIGMGSAVVKKSTLDFEAGFDQDVKFKGRHGTLILAQSQGYTASISGFSTSGEATLDLRDIGFVGPAEASFSGSSTAGVLTVTDGTRTSRIHLTGDYLSTTFTAAGDEHGGTSVTASGGVGGSAPPHGFVQAMARLGGSAGGAIHLAQARLAPETPLARPHAIA